VAGTRCPSLSELISTEDRTAIPEGGEAAAQRRLATFLDDTLRRYAQDRDRPGVDGTSRLSPYLRFGAISVRECVHSALAAARRNRGTASGAHKWVDELIWREFYIGLLAEHPRVLRGAFRAEFECVRWNVAPGDFSAWCEGRTGYPLVDAAMRQLNQTGWVHNRARMVAASFLTKDLLIDWRRGEQVFMQHLIDGEPASNNGGWQWSASTGTDAQPYFRIFNPVAQGERFDPDGRYVRRYVPELRDLSDRVVHRPWDASPPPAGYPAPIVDHADRRVLAVARYDAARNLARRRVG
jgi:deoxyribodipyrimidine photo-lyase